MCSDEFGKHSLPCLFLFPLQMWFIDYDLNLAPADRRPPASHPTLTLVIDFQFDDIYLNLFPELIMIIATAFSLPILKARHYLRYYFPYMRMAWLLLIYLSFSKFPVRASFSVLSIFFFLKNTLLSIVNLHVAWSMFWI